MKPDVNSKASASKNAPIESGLSPSERLERAKAEFLARDALEHRAENSAFQKKRLSVILAPLWIWVLGVVYLPEAFPTLGWVLFHASCWAGFVALVYDAWRAYREDQEAKDFERLKLRTAARQQARKTPSSKDP